MQLNTIKKTIVFQQGQSDCGVACLASIIKYHGGSVGLEKLRELSGTTKQGTTLLGLFQAARQLGFDPKGLEAESVNSLRELTSPAILHVVINNQQQHFLFITALMRRSTSSLATQQGE